LDKTSGLQYTVSPPSVAFSVFLGLGDGSKGLRHHPQVWEP
jgi:hypothetical protein